MSRTNLHINPRFEVNVTDGCEVTDGTATRVTDVDAEFPRGCNAACRLTQSAVGSVYYYFPEYDYAAAYPATPGTDYVASLQYLCPELTAETGVAKWFQVRFFWYDALGNLIDADGKTIYEPATTDFKLAYETATAPDDTATMVVSVRSYGQAETFDLDITQLMIEEGDEVDFWFCGDTPGYAWDGADDASTSSGTGVYTFAHPGMLFDTDDLTAIATNAVTAGKVQKAAWEYYRDEYLTDDTTSHAFVGPVDWSSWSEWQTAYHTTCASDAYRMVAWAYAYYVDSANAATYAARINTLLSSWAAVWLPNSKTDCIDTWGWDDLSTRQVGRDQSRHLFDFGYVFDLVGDDAEFNANRSTIKAWLRDCADREWSLVRHYLSWNWANDHTKYDYEWRPDTSLAFNTYRRSDPWGLAANSPSLMALATLACSYGGDYYPGVARITCRDSNHYSSLDDGYHSHYAPYTSYIDHMLADALTPDNDGDYRDKVGTYAPHSIIYAAPQTVNIDTTDYMHYNLRLQSLFALISRRLYTTMSTDGAHDDYTLTYADEFADSWHYLARLFSPHAVSSPVYDADNDLVDTISYENNKSYHPFGFAIVGSSRLSIVCNTIEEGIRPEHYYEEYVGPTAMLWNIIPPEVQSHIGDMEPARDRMSRMTIGQLEQARDSEASVSSQAGIGHLEGVR